MLFSLVSFGLVNAEELKECVSEVEKGWLCGYKRL